MRPVGSALLILLALSLVGCDHATKYVAAASFQSEAVDLVGGLLTLTYTENRDMAFGLLAALVGESGRLWLLSSAKVLGILVGLTTLVWRRRVATSLEQLGIVLLVSGAIGNLIDRLARGFVVDFIQVPYWPVFNVADIAVVVGVAIISLDLLLRGPSAPAPRASEAAR